MAATTRTNAPTKAELWDELKRQQAELRELNCQVMEVVQQNTRAMTQVQGTIEALSKQLTTTQEVTEKLVQTVTAAVSSTVTGVPMRVFFLVVGVLLIIIMTLFGLKLGGLEELLMGG